ncbi:MAG: hypothetical protein ABIO70_15440 [Pseudomonadota bacterium]
MPDLLRRAAAPLSVFLALLLAEIALFWPILARGHDLLLASNPDGISASWVLATFASGRTLGPWTWHIDPPGGALFVPNGIFSAMAFSPVAAALGPMLGYTAFVMVLLAAGGTALAWAGREGTGSWAPGLLAALVLLGQPVLLQTVRDGEIEHLTGWVLLAALAALVRALRTGLARWAVVGALLVAAMPIEHTYGVAYALLLLPAGLLPPAVAAWRRHGPARLAKIALLALAAAAPLAGLIALLFATSNLGDISGRATDVAAFNSIDLAAWARFRQGGGWAFQNPPSCAPFLDGVTIAAVVGLALLGLPRSAPLLAAGLVFLALSFGCREQNIAYLTEHGGWAGHAVGVAAHWLGAQLGLTFPFSFVRFPRRWALIGGATLLLAAGYGLAALARWLGRALRGHLPPPPATLLAAALLGALAAWGLARTYHTSEGLPGTALPQPAACAWLRAQPGPGAVILLPSRSLRVRDGGQSFADLSPALGAFSSMWLQTLHGRPQPTETGTIPTIRPRARPQDAATAWISTADGIAGKHLDGKPLNRYDTDMWRAPGAAAAARQALHAQGFRWIVIDARAYDGDAADALGLLLGEVAASARAFEDGAGVVVYDLGPME